MTWLEGPTRGDFSSTPGDEDAKQQRRAKSVRCATCRHRVSDEQQRIQVAGHHRHTCVNPAGVVYRIGCFRRADGCKGQGALVAEHSWFAGYAWQVALCGNCLLHLGWAFRGGGERGGGEGFHGLILERVRGA
jgi:hypothetical protein